MFKLVSNFYLVLTSQEISIQRETEVSCLSACLQGNRGTELELFLLTLKSHSSGPTRFNMPLEKIGVIVRYFISG